MMRQLRVAALALVIGFGVGGCQQFQKVQNFVESVQVTATGTVKPQAFLVAINVFDALEVTGTNYLRLQPCPTNAPVCRDREAIEPLIKAIESGRLARNNIKKFLREHPGELGTKGLYDALQLSIDTVQGIYAKYKVQS